MLAPAGELHDLFGFIQLVIVVGIGDSPHAAAVAIDVQRTERPDHALSVADIDVELLDGCAHYFRAEFWILAQVKERCFGANT